MDDDDLRQRFRELRARDARKAPPFDRVTRRRPTSRLRLLVAVVPVVAAAAGLIVWCGATKTASAPPMSASATPKIKVQQTQSVLPLDFLLVSTPISAHLDADPLQGLRP